MELNFQKAGNVHIVGLLGELNSDTSMNAYQEITAKITSSGRVVLDLSGVPYMSSAGIRALLLLYRSIVEQGGRVVLVGLSEDLQDILAITGFLEFFRTCRSVDAGIKYLQ